MFKDKTLNIRKKLITIVIISLEIVAFILIINSYLLKLNRGTKDLKDNWTISYNYKTYSNVVLSDFVFENLEYGEVITLKHDLSDVSTLSSPMISYITRRCASELYVDDELLYSMNMDTIRDYSFCGSGYNRVALRDTSHKQSLVIKLYIVSDHPFSTLEPITIGNSNMIYVDFLTNNLPYLVLSVPTIVLGALFIIFSLILIKKFHEFYEFFFSATFAICSGIWILCQTKLLQLMIDDINISGYIEHLTLYILPFLHTLVFYCLLKNCSNKIKKFNLYVAVTYFIIYIAVIILQASNIIHLQQFMNLFYFVTLVEAVHTFYLLFSHRLINIKTQLYLLKGTTALATIILFDILRSIVVNSFHITSPILNVTFFPIGLIIYIGYFIVAYISYFRTKLDSLKEQEQLEQLAYCDCLTHIYNRTKCECIMEDLDNSNTNFYIISIDLNDLKITNDTKGHSIGDWLLSGFAKALDCYFSKYGYAGRIGGDEFIVFLPDDTKFKDIDTLISSFNLYIANENKKITEFQYSFAYGYASRNEVLEKSSKKVYELADSRMYERKIQMKSKKA